MFCNKCGARISEDATFCSKCGNYLNYTNNSTSPLNNNNLLKQKNMIVIGVSSGIGIVLIVIVFLVIIGKIGSGYYFHDEGYFNDPETAENSGATQTGKKGSGRTAIIIDNVYNGVSISGTSDAFKLISKDSTDQKNKCPAEILQVENEIISKYGITAVNLCEMDVAFARELANVFEVIYNNYPKARGHITNLTLRNTSISENGVIAAFMPVFNFATSNSETTYPWVIKTQVLLSSSFFLNKNKLESSVKDGSSSGHFPPNSTLYSPVAHELGHYLSFLAMLNNYNLDSILLIDNNNISKFYKVYEDFGKGNFSLTMLNEAFTNYKASTTTTLSFDEWRGTISKYALAKNNNGEYIYDETIAEAFHDVYLNKNNAKEASKYIVSVLKKRLGS